VQGERPRKKRVKLLGRERSAIRRDENTCAGRIATSSKERDGLACRERQMVRRHRRGARQRENIVSSGGKEKERFGDTIKNQSSGGVNNECLPGKAKREVEKGRRGR